MRIGYTVTNCHIKTVRLSGLLGYKRIPDYVKFLVPEVVVFLYLRLGSRRRTTDKRDLVTQLEKTLSKRVDF